MTKKVIKKVTRSSRNSTGTISTEQHRKCHVTLRGRRKDDIKRVSPPSHSQINDIRQSPAPADISVHSVSPPTALNTRHRRQSQEEHHELSPRRSSRTMLRKAQRGKTSPLHLKGIRALGSGGSQSLEKPISPSRRVPSASTENSDASTHTLPGEQTPPNIPTEKRSRLRAQTPPAQRPIPSAVDPAASSPPVRRSPRHIRMNSQAPLAGRPSVPLSRRPPMRQKSLRDSISALRGMSSNHRSREIFSSGRSSPALTNTARNMEANTPPAQSIRTWQDKNRELQILVNSLKQKVLDREEELKLRYVQDKAMAEAFKKMEDEIHSLKMENESLRMLRQDTGTEKNSISRFGIGGTESDAHFVRGSGGRRKYLLQINMRFLGPAKMVMARLGDVCTRETQELETGTSAMARNWRNRSEEASERCGLLQIGDVWHAPLCPLDIAQRTEYYTPSYINETDILREAAVLELSELHWTELFTEADKMECIAAFLGDRALREKVKQNLSDAMSSRKRNAKDKLFDTLGYKRLISRMTHRTTAAEQAERESQKAEAFSKLRMVSEYGVEDFSWWRQAEVLEIAYTRYSPPADHCVPVRKDLFFKNKVAILVLKEFQGYDSIVNEVEGTIMTLVRLDAWVATVLHCLMEPDGRGGRHQKRFQELFAHFLPLATHQILSKIRETVVQEAPLDLKVEETERDDDGVVSEDELHRYATVVMRMLSGKRFLAAKSEWFSDNVSRELGKVYDCYIGEAGPVDVSFASFRLPGSGTSDSEEDSRPRKRRDGSFPAGSTTEHLDNSEATLSLEANYSV